MKLRDRFRKHDFSIERIVDTGKDGTLRPFRYIKLTCRVCGQTFIRTDWPLKKGLPQRAIRGCPGK